RKARARPGFRLDDPSGFVPRQGAVPARRAQREHAAHATAGAGVALRPQRAHHHSRSRAPGELGATGRVPGTRAQLSGRGRAARRKCAMRPRLVVAGVLAALVGGVASAQELNLTNASADRPNIIELRTGFDHALVWELGYVRVIDLSGHRLFLSGEL